MDSYINIKGEVYENIKLEYHYSAFFLGGLIQNVNGQIQIIDAYPNLTFSSPIDFQYADNGSNNVYVVERAGVIKRFPNSSSVTSTSVNTFLDISSKVVTDGEGGLLGVAFHPNYNNNGFFYVYYTYDNSGQFTSVISRFERDGTDPSVADPSSELTLLEIEQPFDNHNAGQIRFGHDGYLYIALGDGGGGGDPNENGQDPTTLLGSILRIDVDNPDSGLNYGIPNDNPFVGNSDGWREEIFAYGLRNPWRFSFDAQTGDLWAGDVGQNSWEEIDIIESGKNYGWDIMEGNHCYEPSNGCDQTGLELPVYEYSQSNGDRSVTGGFVYRGSLIPDLQGRYVYGDYVSGNIWSFDWDGSSASDNQLIGYERSVVAFGEDQHRELYILSLLNGTIYKLVPDEVTQFEVQGTTGKDGWRFMGTSKTDESYTSLLSTVWTQGATGADVQGGDPMVYTWDESSQQFDAVPDLTGNIPNAEGFIAYLFEDDDGTTSGIQGGWPKTITSSGTVKSGTTSFPVSYTNGPDSNLDGFNLVANPYPVSIDWDAGSGWTKTNINDAIYIWDPNANSGNGAYKQWVAGSGDLITNIAPYQAFFVQANAENPVLTATEDVQGSWGTFLKSDEDPITSITLMLETDGFQDNAYLAFREEASTGKDASDALKLEPLSTEKMQLYSVTADEIPLAVNSLPLSFEHKIEIPLMLATTRTGEYKLTWTHENTPTNWTLTLADTKTGETFNLNERNLYRFEIATAESREKQRSLLASDGIRLQKSDSQPRFILSLNPQKTGETESPAAIPDEFVLNQNYPNPFNPSTVIRFGLPEMANTTLKIYNILGQEVRTLIDRQLDAGFYEVDFNASGLSSGTYIYQVVAGDFTQSKKMIILK